MFQRLMWRDGVAALLVALLLITYCGFVVAGPFVLIVDNGDMAVVGLGLGFAACVIGGWSPRTDSGRPLWSTLSAVAIILAIVVMGTESALVLALFMAIVVVLWLGTSLGHAGLWIRRSQRRERLANRGRIGAAGNGDSR